MVFSLDVDSLVEEIKSTLKNRGFLKTRLTWHKVKDGIILVLNIQKSQWGPELYVNVGTYISALGSERKPAYSLCHVQSRIAHEGMSPERILQEIFNWFGKHGTVDNLRELAQKDQLPLMTMITAREYLS